VRELIKQRCAIIPDLAARYESMLGESEQRV